MKANFKIHSLHAITHGPSKNKIHYVADLLNEVNSKGLFDADIACRTKKYDQMYMNLSFNIVGIYVDNSLSLSLSMSVCGWKKARSQELIFCILIFLI